MSKVVIVAIPSEDDYTWRLSSQKVPHLTILNLGDNPDNVSRMEQFLEHAVNTSLCGFGLSVDYRGELGDKKADVLFFKKDFASKIEKFRAFLLQDSDIRRAFDSTTQFDGWTPHLTLGFPDDPAKPDDRDYPGIQWVNFDRVALWTGDFEGPTFRLKDRYGWEVEMADAGAEFLSHFGVKGMRWGVRKSYKNFQSRFHNASPGMIKTTVRTKSGEKITIEKEKPGPLYLAVAKLTGAKPAKSLSSMVIRTDTGAKVGSFQMWRENSTTVRGEWLEINKGSQGRGYSRAAIKGLLRAAKTDKDLKEVRLQVPRDAAAAKHIYSSLGFKKDKDLGDHPLYGGLEDWVYTVKRD
jgi:hypothetical protein